jgi:hypothetical protein
MRPPLIINRASGRSIPLTAAFLDFMNRESTQFFILSREKLLFDYERGVLLCKSKDDPEEKRWAKKIPDVVAGYDPRGRGEILRCLRKQRNRRDLSALSRDDGRTSGISR